jgi:hypothetical protein
LTYADAGAAGWKNPTVGSVLRGILSSNTEVGEPLDRMTRMKDIKDVATPEDVRDFEAARKALEKLPKMMDVAIVTDEYIVIFPVPTKPERE